MRLFLFLGLSGLLIGCGPTSTPEQNALEVSVTSNSLQGSGLGPYEGVAGAQFTFEAVAQCNNEPTEVVRSVWHFSTDDQIAEGVALSQELGEVTYYPETVDRTPSIPVYFTKPGQFTVTVDITAICGGEQTETGRVTVDIFGATAPVAEFEPKFGGVSYVVQMETPVSEEQGSELEASLEQGRVALIRARLGGADPQLGPNGPGIMGLPYVSEPAEIRTIGRGRIFIAQVLTEAHREFEEGAEIVWCKEGTNLLDIENGQTGWWYQEGSAQYPIEYSDSPSLTSSLGVTAIRYADHFDTYLLYEPSSNFQTPTIPVPVAKMRWQFVGSVVVENDEAFEDDTSQVNAAWAQTTEYPNWLGNIPNNLQDCVDAARSEG